tara:strand:- start:1586 stop:1867 length:282 start_codon:yes stop_codon:yes gene_type:complete
MIGKYIKKFNQPNAKGDGRQWEKGLIRKTKFTKEYKGLSYEERIQKAALIASDNGRCWWIYDFIKTPVYSFEEKPRNNKQRLDKMKTFIRTED